MRSVFGSSSKNISLEIIVFDKHNSRNRCDKGPYSYVF